MTASATSTGARHMKCPACKAGLKFKGDPSGKRVKCPKCAHQWVVVDVPPEISGVNKALGPNAAPNGQSGPIQTVDGKTDEADLWIGKSLGQFEIIRLLGKGGMGAVYEAMDKILERFVALKVVPKQVSGDPKTLERFLREARSACQISHPNLVGVYQVGQDQGVTFIVMQIVRGGNCSEWVRAKGPMTAAQASWITAEAARGLGAAHSHAIIHRDIKPSNLMLDEAGSVKVADFGLAKSFDVMDVGLTTPGEVVGTPSYMSPEQCKGDGLDPRSDLYSLGATYYFLLTGKPPYTAENPTGIMFKHVYEPVPDPRVERPDLPEGCWQVILRSMAKEPSMRYQTGEEMAADLAQVEAGVGVEAFSGVTGEVSEMPVFDPPPMPLMVGGGGLSGSKPNFSRAYRAGESGTVARLIKQNPVALYASVGGAALLLLVILVFALRGGGRALLPPYQPPVTPVGPGPGPVEPPPSTDGGTKDAVAKTDNGPEIGPKDGSTKTGGGENEPNTQAARMNRLRERLERLKARARNATGRELDPIVAELEQFRKDRLGSATTSEELDLGKAAGAEIDRITDSKYRAEFPPPPLSKPEFIVGGATELTPGTTLNLFDGRVNSIVRLGVGWTAGPQELTFRPRFPEKAGGGPGGSLQLAVADFADFETSMKVKWVADGDQDDFSIRYRYKPSSSFWVCYAPSHAQVARRSPGGNSGLGLIDPLPRVGGWHDLVVQVKGRLHRVLIDGKEIVRAENDDTEPGRFYIFAAGGSVSIKDWKLTAGARD